LCRRWVPRGCGCLRTIERTVSSVKGARSTIKTNASGGRYAVTIHEDTSRNWGLDFAVRRISGVLDGAEGAASAIHYETTCVINQFTNRWSRPSDVAVGQPNPIEIILIRNQTHRCCTQFRQRCFATCSTVTAPSLLFQALRT
jgi:hypothetical protein